MSKPKGLRRAQLKLWAYRILVDKGRAIEASDFAKLGSEDLSLIGDVLLEISADHAEK